MVTPPVLRRLYAVLEGIARQSGIYAGKSGRHMKFPYTLSAKVAQFPLYHYLKNNWIFMYYPPALLTGLYFISKIHSIVNEPAYVRNWEETQRKVAEKEAHH